MALKLGVFWKSDWFLGLVVALLFLFAHLLHLSPLASLEYKAYDIGVAAASKPADDRIVMLTIDNDSINRIGRWPWPRSILADTLDTLNGAGSRAVGVDIFFSEKQTDANARQMVEFLKAQAESLRAEGREEEAVAAERQAAAMDNDMRLVNAVAASGKVVMPLFFEIGEPLGRPDAPLPPYVARMSVNAIDQGGGGSLLLAKSIFFPFEELAEKTAGLGHLNISKDSDGNVRSEPLVVDYFGQFLPSLSLVMAARDLNLTAKDVRLNLGDSIDLGALHIDTDGSMRIYPTFYENAAGNSAFVQYPFYDVYSGRIPAKMFKDKMVLIGLTATGVGETFVTPINPGMTGVEFNAHVIQSLLKAEFFTHPLYVTLIEILLFVLVGLYLALVLPQLNVTLGAVASLVLFLVLIALDIGLLATASLWVQTMGVAMLLLIGHLLLTTKHFFATERASEKISADSAETNKMLGLSFQSQGMLDMAFDKFRKCPLNDDIMAVLYNLALDFERKRQFNKATTVYEYMGEYNANYKDIGSRMERVKNAGETVIFGGNPSGGGMSTLLITGGAKPTLGRYEIVKELGKGAMGTVYLGKDPKINREVAIKTMALSQEFEADELEEVKERFFREAETAGRLNHPNIVTIFDAGEEHDLAYIAMEFLNGTDLTAFTKKEKLLPPIAVLKIVGKVAEALHYAHAQNVVHRDIKPANIMLLRDKSVKVTDFGIARITASSKTKTGVVLGTPSYMSPEQLSGKHVDGRSDLFSLGVMTYEMLTGTRPFRGDSMATLMFQIANEPHPDIREIRPDLPDSVARLIDRALAKDYEARYANGGEMVRGIIQCLNDLAKGNGGPNA